MVEREAEGQAGTAKKAAPGQGDAKAARGIKDTFLVGTLAGTIATSIFLVADGLALLFGRRITAPWLVTADFLLQSHLLRTPFGYAIGFFLIFVLGGALGVAVAYLLRFTGKDYYLIKGIGVTSGFGLISLGSLKPLLGVAPHIQGEPLTILLALLNMTILGAVTSFLVARYADFAPDKAQAESHAAAPAPTTWAATNATPPALLYQETSAELGELVDKLDLVADRLTLLLNRFDAGPADEETEPEAAEQAGLGGWDKVEHLGFKVMKPTGPEEENEDR